MAEINYSKEKTWQIKELLPILLEVEQRRLGYSIYYRVMPQPMTMTWDTFINLSTEEVYASSYDYEDGEAVFLADTYEDILDWVDKNKDIVILKP